MLKGRASRCRARLTSSRGNQLPNLAARDRLSAHAHLGICFHFKSQLVPKLGQQFDIARRLMPKPEVEPFMHLPCMKLVS